METIKNKIRNLHNLPYKKRLTPANEIYNSLRKDGHDGKTSKKIMKSNGVARGILFRLPLREHLQCLSETLEQKPLAHSYNADM